MIHRTKLTVLGVTALALLTAAIIAFWGSKGVNYQDELAKQDLLLKCQEVYDKLRDHVEVVRYGSNVPATVIWSPKTKTCLAYYNVPQADYHNFLFEVWDYTSSDLVLSYQAGPSSQCITNGVEMSLADFMYKYDRDLEGAGCDLLDEESGQDLLTNFETAMMQLGFKK